MKIPLSWLKEHSNSSSKPEHIAQTLTMLGLEVDSIAFADLGFHDVVVAKVQEVRAHPHADHLVIAKLFDGTKEYQVVTSAPNCVAGMKSAYGKVGAKLPGDLLLKEKSFKGIVSEGALLSHEELGLAAAPYGIPGGIMEFDQHIKEGCDLQALFAEPILELSLTPNLAHAASIRGTARELVAGEKGTLLPFSSHVEESTTKHIASYLTLSVEDKKCCPRYCCRVLDNVQVAPSPPWLKARIEAAGMRSINNVVDITNYVMLELGHPLHAFDLNNIEGKHICVRKAAPNEVIQTLDGQTHHLTDEMLVIASATKPIAIAGVMGSLDSEVTLNTQTIVLESAYFTPAQVRRTSKHRAIQSAASYRFERGADRGALMIALERATELLQKHCGGEVAAGIYDSNQESFSLPAVTLRLARIEKLLGLSLTMSQVEEILTRLNLKIVASHEGVLTVEPPTYRHDLAQEIDLIEEVARLYGYHNLMGKAKPMWHRGSLLSSPLYLFEKKVRSFLLQCNLQEVLTCDLISPLQAELVPADVMATRTLLHLLNPSSLDHSILRPSLLPGLLTTLKDNLDHDIPSMAIFEVGRIHFTLKERFIEPSMAALLLAGAAQPPHWQNKERFVDFYDLKGIVEAFLMHLDVKDMRFTPSTFSNFHPKCQAHIFSGDRLLGVIGEVHPLILKKLDITKRTFFAELNLDDLRGQQEEGAKKMKALAIYPASKRDWTLPLSKKIAIDTIFSLIKKCHSSLLESVSLVDIYENESLGSDLVHATFRFCYRDQQQTISMQEVEREHAMITQNVLSELNRGKTR